MYLGKEVGGCLALAILERMEAYSSAHVLDFISCANLLWALPSPYKNLAFGPYWELAHLVSGFRYMRQYREMAISCQHCF